MLLCKFDIQSHIRHPVYVTFKSHPDNIKILLTKMPNTCFISKIIRNVKSKSEKYDTVFQNLYQTLMDINTYLPTQICTNYKSHTA